MVHDPQIETALPDLVTIVGTVKWFDPVKGFGFVVSDAGGVDVLIHMNVLRNFGQSSIADGAQVKLQAVHSTRGMQAVELISVMAPETSVLHTLTDFDEMDMVHVSQAPLEPARVKWFDKSKGFGFANVFGNPEDIFLHVEVLRQSGLSDVQPGEALALKVMDGKRGKMAAKVQAWESVDLDHFEH